MKKKYEWIVEEGPRVEKEGNEELIDGRKKRLPIRPGKQGLFLRLCDAGYIIGGLGGWECMVR